MTGPVFAIAAVGVATMAIAAIGLLRMPDFLTRMHASSKAGTLGALLVMIAVAVHFREPAIVVRALLVSGHEVVGLTRSHDKAQWLLGDTDARFVVGDMRDVAAFAVAVMAISAPALASIREDLR